ncbi:MAG TPA: histidine phosphatase family protein [Candidatus Didemnitutus sp.]|nr:histidine phosphatase family protein [Candidatus Didemnitutus sp.]
MVTRVHVIRHGETEWSATGRHTGRTEVPLNSRGEARAAGWKGRLDATTFSAVLVSPRRRAQQTCALAGLGERMRIEPDLVEWDYGDYEGLRSAEIHALRPDWNLFADGCPRGESTAEVGARADRLIARLQALEGEVILFSHGHFGRVLAARWMRLPVAAGARLEFSPAGHSILGFEHGDPAAPVVVRWNELAGSD